MQFEYRCDTLAQIRISGISLGNLRFSEISSCRKFPGKFAVLAGIGERKLAFYELLNVVTPLTKYPF